MQASSSKKRHASTQPSVEPETSSKRRKHHRDSQDSDDDGEHTKTKDKGKGKEKEVVADKRSEGKRGKRRDKGKKVDDDDEASPATLVSSDHEASKHAGEVERLLQKDSPPPQTAPELADQQTEIARLRKELATKDDLLTKHQETFASLQGVLSCQICLELMLEPYMYV